MMREWLTPLIVDQRYWNDLHSRRMDALERKERRRAVSDVEFDQFHGDVNQ
jgi:hypothetical protein